MSKASERRRQIETSMAAELGFSILVTAGEGGGVRSGTVVHPGATGVRPASEAECALWLSLLACRMNATA